MLAAALGLLAASAAQAPSAKSFAGMIPDLPTPHVACHQPVAHAANLPYGGGPVLHSNRTHLIFWQPAGSGLTFDPGYEALIERFLSGWRPPATTPTNVYGADRASTPTRRGPAAYASSYGGATV